MAKTSHQQKTLEHGLFMPMHVQTEKMKRVDAIRVPFVVDRGKVSQKLITYGAYYTAEKAVLPVAEAQCSNLLHILLMAVCQTSICRL